MTKTPKQNRTPKAGNGRAALDPEQRVILFVDGWNLHRACERAFKQGPVHPLLLGRALAGPRKLVGVRYFVGVPDPRVEPENAARRTRQLEFMAKTGVDVFPKKLRYRHEWKFNKWDLPDPRKHEGETLETSVISRRQGREKGVDVELALSAFHAAHDRSADALVIVSADTDLDLIPHEVDQLRAEQAIRVENAVVNTSSDKYINHAYDWSHQINEKMFAQVRDDFDWDKPITRKQRNRFLSEHGRLS